MRLQTGHSDWPAESELKWGESRRSPQTEHNRPRTGRIWSRQSAQTGSREILTSGAPQIWQSAGNRTAKRLSAARRAQAGVLRGTIESPATITLAWLARIRSSLLLKTASLRTTPGKPSPGSPFPKTLLPWEPLHQQYKAAPAARQRYGRAVRTAWPSAAGHWPPTTGS